MDTDRGSMNMTRSIVSRSSALALGLALLVPGSTFAAPPAAEPVSGEVAEVQTMGNLEDLIVGGPVTAEQGAQGQDLGQWSNYAEPGDLSAVPPAGTIGDSPNLDRAGGALFSIASTVGSVLYFPIKIVVGVAGAWIGGVAGALTGGDQSTAAGIWNLTTDGDYFVSPEELEGDREFRLTGDHR